MKNLKDLKAERQAIKEKLNNIASDNETDVKELRTQFDTLTEDLKNIDEDIRRMEMVEQLNKQEVKETVETPVETKSNKTNLINGLRSFFQTGIAPEEFRSPRGGFLLPIEDLRTGTTEVGEATEKTVVGGIQIAKSPAETMLNQLGVKIQTGLVGDYVVPAMAQVDAGFVNEGSATSDVDASLATLKLSPRRVGGYNIFTKEMIAQTNPGIYNDIIQDLYDSVWRAVAKDLFVNVDSDAADSMQPIAGSKLEYADIVDLEAAVPYDLVSPKFVGPTKAASYLKKMPTIDGVAGPVWDGNILSGNVDGIPAVGTNFATANKFYYGDFSKAIIGSWGNIELQVNPYEFDVEGKIKVVVTGLFDSGVANPNFFAIINDTSIA